MTLHELNNLDPDQLKEALLKCCGSRSWANKMIPIFPVESLVGLLKEAEQKWYHCSEKGWKEAFAGHPRIGDLNSLKEKFASTAHWAEAEQGAAGNASNEVIEALAEGNRLYEEKFGYIFIVCATGRPAAEMLEMLRERLSNTPEKEILIAAEEQNRITKIRIEKLLK